jgi:hypothetical protein
MKLIIDKLKKLWEKLDGKKTTIGVTVWLVTRLLHAAFPAINPYTEIMQDGIEYWLFGSMIHKGIKTQTGKKIINSLKK